MQLNNGKKLIKFTDKKYKKHRKLILDSQASGKLNTYIKHPQTGGPVLVHQSLVKRMHEGETITLEEILGMILH